LNRSLLYWWRVLYH